MGQLRILPLFAGLAMAASAFAATPPAASSMIDGAVKDAKAAHKGVIVIFHASWCGWCKQLDKTLAVPEFKSIIDKDFLVLHVTVMENAAHKEDENPGGADLLAKMGGATAGLPFYSVLNSDGKQVADSMLVEGKDPKPQNMGFPTETAELTHFLDMLKLGNPSLTSDDTASLEKVLAARAAEIKATQQH